MRSSRYTGLANREQTGEIKLRPVFYGDLFANWQAQGDDPMVATALDPVQRELEEQLALALLGGLAARAEDDADRETAAAALIAAGVERADLTQAQASRLRRDAADIVGRLLSTRWAGGHRLARVMVDRAPRVSWLPLREVSDYLLHHREAIQQRLLDALAPGDVRVVIAHSLGSVVAWETLARCGMSLPLLVTVGSPLGIRGAIYDRLKPTPPCWPGGVQAWTNLSAPNDIVATPQELGSLFPSPHGRPLLDDAVQVRSVMPLGPHAFNRYLEAAKVWHPVAMALDKHEEAR